VLDESFDGQLRRREGLDGGLAGGRKLQGSKEESGVKNDGLDVADPAKAADSSETTNSIIVGFQHAKVVNGGKVEVPSGAKEEDKVHCVHVGGEGVGKQIDVSGLGQCGSKMETVLPTVVLAQILVESGKKLAPGHVGGLGRCSRS
jgi:hypothetical protein